MAQWGNIKSRIRDLERSGDTYSTSSKYIISCLVVRVAFTFSNVINRQRSRINSIVRQQPITYVNISCKIIRTYSCWLLL
jgi:hypothetical protein